MQRAKAAVSVWLHCAPALAATAVVLLLPCDASAPFHAGPRSGLFRSSESGFEWRSGPFTADLRGDGVIQLRSGSIREQLRFMDVTATVRLHGDDAAAVVERRFAGPQADWVSGCAYSRVRYDDLYPGISVVFRADATGRLEYDFELRPGADPARIGVRFDGPVRIDTSGRLLVGRGPAELVQHAPAVYQWKDGRKSLVSARYRIDADRTVRFDIDSYDTASGLVIDPVLSFTSMIDGTGYDSVVAVAADREGNVYIAGETDSTSFGDAGLRSNRDAFVAKLARNTTGFAVVYIAYLGGSSQDAAHGVAVDQAGNAYVAGLTSSTDFPTTAGAFQTAGTGGEDAFVAKLDSDGRLVYSARIGSAGYDSASSIAVGAAGEAYVAGYTSSPVFPGAGYRSPFVGQGDCFVAKLDAAGSTLLYSALLGGNGFDTCTGIAVGPDATAYVAGITYSPNFPTSNPSQPLMKGPVDAFVARLRPDGDSMVFSTFLGGSGTDLAYALALDASGAAYVAGSTLSTDFPTTPLAYQGSAKGDYDAFVAKLAPDGARLFATLLGGSAADTASAVTVDERGNIVVGGTTQSLDLRTVDAFQGALSAGGVRTPVRDGFVAVLRASGWPSLVSYVGGFGDDAIGAVTAVNGRIYAAGETTSFDFPGAAQTTVSNTAAFVAEIYYGPPSLAFFPLTPCRLVDTRPVYGKPGPYGPPALTSASERDVPIAGNCGVPSTAKAVSINLGVVPSGPVGYVSVWPAGEPFPRVSNLSSPDGSNIANAAIVTLGESGAVTVRAATAYPTHLTMDINGYFDVPGTSDLTLYTIAPCRAVETRAGLRASGPFGPPALARFADRSFRLPQSDCAIPASAAAFVFNVTALPQAQSLGYVSIWPEGTPFPTVATLQSPLGANIANLAIVAAGAQDGGITARATDATNATFDVNGYFAPNDGSTNALHYYPIPPCRVVDTREVYNFPVPFGPPGLAFREARDFPLQVGPCAIPSTVRAYALNVTVVPQGPSLDFLSMWPAGMSFPNTALLVSPRGLTISNAAIVSAGTGQGAPIRVFASNATDLVIDITGYFAP